MKFITGREGVETCNTHNMLKLTEGLFRMKPDARYADFFERALYNHILASVHPQHGGYVYFTPAHPRHYRVYSAPDVAMWCCVGTGMENPAKYGQFIYAYSTDSLFVNLFIASELDWKNRGIQIIQDTKFPDEERTVLTVNTNSQKAFKLCIRHPEWVPKGEMKVIIDNDTLGQDSEPSSYVAIMRTWNGGEKVTVHLPMHFTYEKLINVPDWIAFRRGPIVLAAKTGTDNLPGLVADASRMGHVASGTLLDHNSAPKLKVGTGSFPSHFKPVDGKSLTYKAPGLFVNSQDTNLVFEPFFRVHDARYMMYWNATIVEDTVKAVSSPKRNQLTNQVSIHNDGSFIKITVNSDMKNEVSLDLYNLNGRVVHSAHFNSGVTQSCRIPTVGMANGLYIAKIKCGNIIQKTGVFLAGK
ncbi:MAG: glycoside hydrolase family 127 protein [Fibrobacter sp.]|nr:glycoside hydrolase family 127 protein [Fibrobacter sp.]